jgi:hypothetical protein
MFYLFLIFLLKLYSYLTFYIISLFFYKKTFVKLEKDIIFSLIKPIEMYLKVVTGIWTWPYIQPRNRKSYSTWRQEPASTKIWSSLEQQKI